MILIVLIANMSRNILEIHLVCNKWFIFSYIGIFTQDLFAFLMI